MTGGVDMHFKYKTFCALLVLLSSNCLFASPSKIDNASNCSSKMGNGGNYYSDATGKLSGKCEGDGLAPTLTNDKIIFSVQSESDALIKKPHIKDRTELAFTENRIQYNKDYVFDFKVQIDPNSDATNDFYYVMQVWEGPEYSPIFGLRIDRGTKDSGAFIVRNEQDSVAGKRLVGVSLGSKLQHYQVHMNIGKDLNSKIKIYENSNVIADWSGKIGYPSEMSSNKPNSLMLKFGIYKGSEPTKNFKVYFKDVTLNSINQE